MGAPSVASSVAQPTQSKAGADLLGGLGGLDFNSSQAATTDLIGSSDVFSATPATASSTAQLDMFSTQQQAPSAPVSGAAQLGANLDLLYKQSAVQVDAGSGSLAQAATHAGAYNAFGGVMPVGSMAPGNMQGGMMMPPGGIAPGSVQGGVAGAYACIP